MNASQFFVTWSISNALKIMSNNLHRTTSNFILFITSGYIYIPLYSPNFVSQSMVFSSFNWMKQWVLRYFMMAISPQSSECPSTEYTHTKNIFYRVALGPLIIVSHFAELVCLVRYKCRHFTWHVHQINHFIQL